MQRPKPKLTENKLLMLYTIDCLGALTNGQTLRFFIENELMDYIDVQLSLAELTEGKLLCANLEPLGTTYSLTQLGKDAVRYFKSRIPASRRQAVDEAAGPWRDIIRRETQLFADYTAAPGGDVIVRLAARENGALLFEMNISVPDAAQARVLCENWETRSGQVYKTVMDLLTAPDGKPKTSV